MDAAVATCPACGTRNRLGTPPRGQLPRCGRCKAPLPWLVDAGDADFDAQIAAAVPVLVDFWAPWCGPCRTIAPALVELSREHAGALKVVKVDVDRNPATAGRFGVQGIPMLAIFHRGEQVDTLVGAHPKSAIAERLRPYLGR